MKRISLILVLLGIGCILLSQIGCQKAESSVRLAVAGTATPPEKQTPKKPVAVAQEATEAEKPKPAPAKPKPAPNKAVAKVDPNAPAPRIKFDKLVHNFGDIDPGSNNICEFPFKNVGKALLKIINVKPDCRCTQFTLEKKEYAPGEGGAMKFKYHAVSRAGPVNRRIIVTTNDPVEPRITLRMKGKVVQRVAYEPKKLNLLLKGDDQTLPKITLTSLDGKPFSIKSVKSSANALIVEFDPAVEATKFVLQLKLDMAQLQKVSNGTINFTLTHPAAKSVSIPFSALTRFRINPPTIILFDAEPGKPIIKNKVTILNNYQEDFEIASVKSKTGITKVIKQEKIRYGYTFSLQITPPDVASGTKRFSDVVTITVKGGESLTIKCTGFYKRKKN